MKISEHANYLLNEYGRLQFDYAAYYKPYGESLRNEARNNLEEYIAELEAEVTRLLTERDDAIMAEARYIAKVELAKKDARIAELEAESERLRLERLADDSGSYDSLIPDKEFEELRARIAELEAERRWIPVGERLPEAERKCKALESENAELRDVIGDYRNDVSRVLDEKCPSDERHCGCVPILREQLNKYQTALILITTMPELSQATTIAREALQERGKYIWTEQSVGEYWVTKLDILQDKFDSLEKDYASVCQKRLEAADVFSRQIIELESENAELKADLKNARIAELEAEVTKCHELQDSYCDRIAQLEKEIARRDEELLELNNKAVFINFENEDELPAEIKDDVYSAMFECSHVDGVRLFPYIEENGQKYFLVMLKEDE